MAQELARVHLIGQGRITEDEEDHRTLADLLTVFLGMGVFPANSVLRENYWHAGAVSGWSMRWQNNLTMPEFGYAFALFAWAREDVNPLWAKELRADVRSAFQQGARFLAETGESLFQPQDVHGTTAIKAVKHYKGN